MSRMNPAEVVVPNEQSNGMSEVFKFLGITQGASGKSSGEGPQAKVGAFCMANGVHFDVWISAYTMAAQSDQFAGHIPQLRLGKEFGLCAVIN